MIMDVHENIFNNKKLLFKENIFILSLAIYLK